MFNGLLILGQNSLAYMTVDRRLHNVMRMLEQPEPDAPKSRSLTSMGSPCSISRLDFKVVMLGLFCLPVDFQHDGVHCGLQLLRLRSAQKRTLSFCTHAVFTNLSAKTNVYNKRPADAKISFPLPSIIQGGSGRLSWGRSWGRALCLASNSSFVACHVKFEWQQCNDPHWTLFGSSLASFKKDQARSREPRVVPHHSLHLRCSSIQPKIHLRQVHQSILLSE